MVSFFSWALIAGAQAQGPQREVHQVSKNQGNFKFLTRSSGEILVDLNEPGSSEPLRMISRAPLPDDAAAKKRKNPQEQGSRAIDIAPYTDYGSIKKKANAAILASIGKGNHFEPTELIFDRESKFFREGSAQYRAIVLTGETQGTPETCASFAIPLERMILAEKSPKQLDPVKLPQCVKN